MLLLEADFSSSPSSSPPKGSAWVQSGSKRERVKSGPVDLQHNQRMRLYLGGRNLELLERGEIAGVGGEQKLDAVGGPFNYHCFYNCCVNVHGDLGTGSKAHGGGRLEKAGEEKSFAHVALSKA